MCTLKGDFCYRYLWLGVWERSILTCRALLDLWLQAFPISSPFLLMRPLAAWTLGGEREPLPELRVEFCLSRDPVRGLRGKRPHSQVTGLWGLGTFWKGSWPNKALPTQYVGLLWVFESLVGNGDFGKNQWTFSPSTCTPLLSVFVVPKCLHCPYPSATLASAWHLELGLV